MGSFQMYHLEKAAHKGDFSQKNIRWWAFFTLLLGIFLQHPWDDFQWYLLSYLLVKTIPDCYRIFGKYRKIENWTLKVT